MVQMLNKKIFIIKEKRYAQDNILKFAQTGKFTDTQCKRVPV